MKRSISGITPSGKIHLGNYFGAVKQYIKLQNENTEGFYFVANYHALTTLPDKKTLKENTFDIVLDYLALGIDPNKSTIFLQSDLPEIHELSWYLSTLTPLSTLEKCHAYKDKTSKGFACNHALFAYPVLMAADILAYQTDIVPVGQDQKQHVEVTRDLAISFNHHYGNIFKLPEPVILKSTAIVPGTDGQKMSKSYNNTIQIFAPESEIKKNIMRIVTDSKSVEDIKEPETCNIFKLYKLVAGDNEADLLSEKYKSGNMGYGYSKNLLLDAFMSYFSEARKNRTELLNNKDYVFEILNNGAKKAKYELRKTLDKIRKKTGIQL